MIYFLQGDPSGPIKIGYTDNLPARIESLSLRHNEPLVCLGVISGGYKEEKYLHWKFSHLNIKEIDGVEWFRPEQELTDYIQMFSRPYDGSEVHDGAILAANLERLGYSVRVVKVTEVSKLVSDKTGKTLSRQKLSVLLNSINIRPETIELIAKGLGVDPKELMKWKKP